MLSSFVYKTKYLYLVCFTLIIWETRAKILKKFGLFFWEIWTSTNLNTPKILSEINWPLVHIFLKKKIQTCFTLTDFEFGTRCDIITTDILFFPVIFENFILHTRWNGFQWKIIVYSDFGGSVAVEKFFFNMLPLSHGFWRFVSISEERDRDEIQYYLMQECH